LRLDRRVEISTHCAMTTTSEGAAGWPDLGYASGASHLTVGSPGFGAITNVDVRQAEPELPQCVSTDGRRSSYYDDRHCGAVAVVPDAGKPLGDEDDMPHRLNKLLDAGEVKAAIETHDAEPLPVGRVETC
jgi:hypothetical protein